MEYICTNAETKVTTTSITELKGSIFIDQFATKLPELIHSNISKFPYVLFWIPFQNKIIENTAEILTNKLVVISEKYLINDLPKKPSIDPTNGKKIIAYSIYPFIPWISSTLIEPLFL